MTFMEHHMQSFLTSSQHC